MLFSCSQHTSDLTRSRFCPLPNETNQSLISDLYHCWLSVPSFYLYAHLGRFFSSAHRSFLPFPIPICLNNYTGLYSITNLHRELNGWCVAKASEIECVLVLSARGGEKYSVRPRNRSILHRGLNPDNKCLESVTMAAYIFTNSCCGSYICPPSGTCVIMWEYRLKRKHYYDSCHYFHEKKLLSRVCLRCYQVFIHLRYIEYTKVKMQRA